MQENTMAEKVSECDLTTCTICLEQLNIPKYLPCLHTFCESCLIVYITSLFEKGSKTRIECPVCRASVEIPDENYSAEQWAKHLPLNFLLVGLIEKHKVQRPEKICMSCERLDVETKSEAMFICVDCSDTLCDTCVKYHKINKSTTQHELVLVTDIASENKTLKAFKYMCSVHKNKELELYCKDHGLPCCSLCVSVTHRKCESVLTLEDAAKVFVNSDVINEIREKIKNLSDDFETTLCAKRTYLGNLESKYMSETEKCENYWKDVHRELQIIEGKQKSRYRKLFETQKAEMELSISVFENRKKAIDNDYNILDVSVKEASHVQVMIESEKLKDHITQYGADLTTSLEEVSFEFEFKKEISEIKSQFENDCTLRSKSNIERVYLSYAPEKKSISVSEMEDEKESEKECEDLKIGDGDDAIAVQLLGDSCPREEDRPTLLESKRSKSLKKTYRKARRIGSGQMHPSLDRCPREEDRPATLVSYRRSVRPASPSPPAGQP